MPGAPSPLIRHLKPLSTHTLPVIFAFYGVQLQYFFFFFFFLLAILAAACCGFWKEKDRGKEVRKRRIISRILTEATGFQHVMKKKKQFRGLLPNLQLAACACFIKAPLCNARVRDLK